MFKGDRNFTVGLFVSIAIAVLVTFVIWLTGRTGVEEMKRYTLMFPKDVSGLAVGGPVKYMGMNVGTVVHMALERELGGDDDVDDDHHIRVRVDIDILETTPVDRHTFASLALQGITGVAVVNLARKIKPKNPPLNEREYPEIPVEITGFSALMADAPEIMSKLNSLLTQAVEILGDENRAAIAGTLENIEDLTTSLAEERETIAAIPANLNQTISDIQATVLQLQDTVGELRPGIGSIVENIDNSSRNLASLTGRLDAMVQEHQDDMGRFMEDGLGEAPALMAETRTALRDLEKLVQELQHDPSQLIYRQAENSVNIEP